jgi:hypothetical protein
LPSTRSPERNTEESNAILDDLWNSNCGSETGRTGGSKSGGKQLFRGSCFAKNAWIARGIASKQAHVSEQSGSPFLAAMHKKLTISWSSVSM